VSLRDQLKSDLKNVIFNTNDFAETAIYTPKATGVAKNVNGIFRENFADETIVGTRSKVAGSNPHFQCSQDDIAATDTATGDTLKLRGKTYYILDSELKSNTTIVLNLSNDKP
jgi:hypothetical protein